MDKTLTIQQLDALCKSYGYELAMVRAIISVESSGIGFSRLPPYRMIIRFEPSWYKRDHKDWNDGTTAWQNLGVQDQAAMYKAFNEAFAEDKHAAMLATSVGMMQMMGFHYAELGFKLVDDFFTYNQQSEINQVECALKWIKSVPKLDHAVKALNYDDFAYYYNGSGYKELAAKNHELPYNIRIFNARNRFLITA